jgi:hypothetical protein
MNEDDCFSHVFDPMWESPGEAVEDLRNIKQGTPLLANYYADQPYLAETLDGGLLCVVTTGTSHEGSSGQHVMSMKSFDGGRTWRDRTPVEAPTEPISSWGVPITTPSGRVFVFYIFNKDDLKELPADDPPYPGGVTHRVDTQGYYAFRWSDDHGKTWSKERGYMPVREFAIDRSNPTGGKIRFFWNVGKAFISEGSIYVPLHKVGGFGEGWLTSSEGALVCSEDLLTAEDPLSATWTTLPEGEYGIRSPEGGGPVAEEHSFAVLSDGSFFTVFRTIDCHPGCAYSRDKGRTWSKPQYMRFASGKLMKHPRAANFVWKMKDGGYLYHFHNHGGPYLREHPERRTICYTERNPVWLCRGWEEDSPEGKVLAWSQPEVGLFADDPMIRMSYPDFVEHKGEFLFTETEKAEARIHRLSPRVVQAVRKDNAGRTLEELTPICHWQRLTNGKQKISMPPLPPFIKRADKSPFGSFFTGKGFSIELLLELTSPPAHRCNLLFNRGPDGSGLVVALEADNTLSLLLNDGQTCALWESDPLEADGNFSHIFITVDSSARLICFYENGVINDGGENRQFGWGRLSPYFRNKYMSKELTVNPVEGSSLAWFKFYGRALCSWEVEAIVHQTKVISAY